MSNEDDLFIRGLSDEENRTLKSLAKKFLANRTERYLDFHGTPWSTNCDAVVYIDDEGCDTAHGDGADIVLSSHLSRAEIARMEKDGFIIKGNTIFAFSRFLMESFVKASILLKLNERTNQEVHRLINEMLDEYPDRKTLDGTVVRPGLPS